jgi:hypothetical protein
MVVTENINKISTVPSTLVLSIGYVEMLYKRLEIFAWGGG